MSERPTLAEVFSRAEYRLSGHGPRNADVLKAVLEQVDGNMESDMYGKGKVIEDFQEEMAAYLGKEAAVFFPSGTMAQQIALRIHCDENKLAQVAYHPLCHLEIHEEDGLKELHGIRPILLADRHRLITLEDVTGLGEEIACLLLELPQREIGGQLPEFRELEAIAAYCREKGIKLHLDGARLFEILPYYGKTAAEVCALFDSVYVSFYKSIGGIAGAILAGDAGFAEQSKVWKRRHGGDLISLYPYILTSAHYFKERIGRMDRYYREALALSEQFQACRGVTTRPAVPVSNLFHVHFDAPKDKVEPLLIALCEETGIGVTGSLRDFDGETSYFELSVGDGYALVPEERRNDMFRSLDGKLSGIL
ncbi:DegT/DnrJ/EryC1/StrS family aminotransferase [Paenibacillus sp. alder61]|uniref:threonine aldolase family protein n=1 Tax=Paenibacillus sp. alder61 TaxID=2862948 RepID=UPI001CD6DED2|nr:beta-eliminating lyase-related protein [Paenibacillus sp. alder61]MCA1294826.1 DegT/DnrJ/EryC1/StrS family aminotransferase [Paenibacillus sp. alder61]